MSDLLRTDRSTVRRLPARASYDRADVDAILDEGLVAHVGLAVDGQPFVIPMVYARAGERLFLHGSAASRTARALATGVPVCVTVTLLDGLVLARSAFHHSMNYRSVVILGTARAIVDPDERLAALRAIVEHMYPGRWDATRPPNAQELKATTVLALPIQEATAKARTGPPIDDAADLALPHWAGVLPIRLAASAPIPDPGLPAGVPMPAALQGYRRPPAASPA